MPKGYQSAVPASIQAKVLADLKAYKAKEKLSDWALAKKLDVTTKSIQKWLTGKVHLTTVTVTKLGEAGVTEARLPEQVRQAAINKILLRKDATNRIPRAYRRRVEVPDLVNNQMKLVLDEYVKGLRDSRTWEEHEQQRNAVVGKLFYLAKQGE